MFQISPIIQRLSAGAIVLAMWTVPIASAAQDVPSYAQPAYVSTDETIHGRIRSVDGAFNISVDDDRGFIDSIQLHQGTIINPTGLTLSPGMSVTIAGVNAGSTFNANEIDTPYTYAGPLPTPVYYGPGYWCPGFAYGYGPSFSLAIVIGGGGYRPWYYEHRDFYGRPWNGHAYFGGYVGVASVNRGRVEETRSFSNPGIRAATATVRTDVHTSAPHAAPPTFAQRTFGGETRVAAPGSGETRVAAPGSNETRVAAPGSSVHTERAPSTVRSLPSQSRSAYEPTGRSAGGNGGGGGRSAGGGSSHAGGGGHAH